MNRRLLLILSFLCYLPSLAQRTGTITGTVTSEAGQPLAGVSIFLQDKTVKATTQTDGSFTISGLSLGSYTVSTKSVGYTEKHQDVVLTEDSPNLVLTLTLSPAHIQLQEVEVLGRKETTYKSEYSFIGTRTASSVMDVPQTISTVTKELMDDQQAYRLTDVVKNISGVNQYSQWDDLTVRGFRNGYESGFRLLNGLRSGFSYGNGFFRVPLTANLERIEVLKGPGSALYGDINPGGTINMVTKKPLAEERKALSFSVGSFKTSRAALDFTGPLNESKTLLYRLNVGYEDTETFKDVISNQSLLIAPTVTFLPTDQTTINAELVYSHFNGYLDRGLPIQGGNLYALPFSFVLNQPSDYFKVNDFYLNASLNHRFTNWLSFNASYLRFTYQENLSEHRTRNTFVDAPQNTVMNMQYYERRAKEYTDNFSAYLVANGHTGPIGHKLLVGVDYVKFDTDKNSTMWEARQKVVGLDTVGLTFDLKNPVYESQDPTKYIRRPTPAFFIDYINAVYHTTGVYVQESMDVSKRLTLLLALRYEQFQDERNYGNGEEQIKQNVLLPRLGVLYRLTDYLNYFASYSSGFRPLKPEFIKFPERYGSNKAFQNETSYQAETGLKSELFNKALLATASFYLINKDNVLVNTGQVNEEGNPVYRQNGKVQSKGLELEVTGNLTSNLSVNATYAYNQTEVIESALATEKGMRAANAPAHTTGIWAKYTFTLPYVRGLGFAVGASYVSRRRMENQVTSGQTGELVWAYWPSYKVADAALFYSVNKFRLTVNLNNLLGEKYFVGGYDYYRSSPGTPRNFMATIGYTF